MQFIILQFCHVQSDDMQLILEQDWIIVHSSPTAAFAHSKGAALWCSPFFNRVC